jgi:cell division transport system permease protein
MRYWEFVKRNIRRTPYQAIAATMVMFVTFLALLVFMILVIGSQRILHYFESKPQAIAFFQDNTTEQDVQAIENALKATGKVTELNYVDKQQALKNYQEMNKSEPLLLELVTANILPASLEIHTTNLSDLNSVGDMLKKEPVVEQVIIPESAIQGLTNATRVIRYVGGATAVFLMVFSFFLLLMVIGFKIRIRRTEIETMNLLGASKLFIRAPFILEGIVYGIVGAFLAWAVVYGLLWYFAPPIQFNIKDLPASVVSVPPPPIFMLILLGIILGVGAIIGMLGSYGAVRRYLKL